MKILVVGDFQGKFSEKVRKKILKEDFDFIIGVGDYTGVEDWIPYIRYFLRQARNGKEVESPTKFFGKKKMKELLKKDEVAMKNVLKELDSFGKPVLYVMGNGDDEWYDYPFIGKIKRKMYGFRLLKKNERFLKRLKNFKSLNYRARKFRGKSFVGFGGYMDIDAFVEDKEFIERDGPEMVKKRKARMKKSGDKLDSLMKKARGEKILVLHYPPKGVFDIIKDKKNPMDGKSAGIRAFRSAILKYKPRLVLCGHMHEYQGKKKLGSSLIVNPGDMEKGKYAIVDYPGKKGNIKVKFVS